jgi:hypothetical protein
MRDDNCAIEEIDVPEKDRTVPAVTTTCGTPGKRSDNKEHG